MKKQSSFLIICTLIFVLITSTHCKENEESTDPVQSSTVTDKDGNVYKTVKIGTQIWMAENLKTTKFNDGSSISLLTGNNLNTPAYCWYNDDVGNKDIYGALYNWYSVGTGKLCPTGFHVPSDVEWTALFDYLGGKQIAGGKMKETGTIHWKNPNTGATNSSGFTALPGGFRELGKYYQIWESGDWWSSTEYLTAAGHWKLWNDDISVSNENINKTDGFSVRCLKD
jgi:uncharacterized protein (TIGR02145 family)